MTAKISRRALWALCVTLQWSLVLAFPDAPLNANSSTASLAGNSTNSQNATSQAAADKKAAQQAAQRAARARSKAIDDRNWAVVRAFVYFWVGLFLLFGLSLMLLVFRRYIRTVSSLSPGNTQAYFAPVNRTWGMVKKHFVFAPLFNKRHHRPFMITRTIDNGCLPSRPQTFVLVTYFILLVAATFYGIDYSRKRHDIITSIERRSGSLALANMVPLFLFAARNNPLIWWTGISFDSYNLFHRWLGRFVTLEVFTHAITYIVKKVEEDGWAGFRKRVATSKFVRSGLITACCVMIILIQTPSPIRHKFYETFLHIHQILAAVVVWGIWTHMNGYTSRRKVVALIIAIWAIERTFRLLRILYRNVGKPMTTAEIEVVSPIAMRVKVRLPRPWTFTPGQHAYIYMPFVGMWTAHPFSLAWTDEDAEEIVSEKDSLPKSIDDVSTKKRNFYFLIRRMKGFTNNLYTKTEKAGGKLTTTALLEGPYNQQTLHSYGTVVLVAAGIGITHIVPHVYDLVRGYGLGSVAARRVTMIWGVRSLEELDLIRDWMTIILALPRRHEVLRVMLYVFDLDTSKVNFPSTTIQVFPGIAKFGPIIDEEVKNSVGAIGVSVCGLGVVADEVRFACRKWMDKVNIEFMEESFSW